MTDPSHRHGTFNVVWTKGGQPLDRWQRDVEAVREHAEFVAGKAEELRAYVASLDDVLFGRETGPRFWSRFKANIAALERVVERDTMYVELLEQLAAREAAKRAARLPPGLPVGPFGGPGGTPTPSPRHGVAPGERTPSRFRSSELRRLRFTAADGRLLRARVCGGSGRDLDWRVCSARFSNGRKEAE